MDGTTSNILLVGDLCNNSTRSSVADIFEETIMTSWLAYGGYAARAILTPSSYVPQEILLLGNRKEIKVIM